MTDFQPPQPTSTTEGRRIRTWAVRGLLAAIAIAIPATTLAIVSPFGDVDPSNTFYNNIVNMANSGITSGCGGGNFCPKDYVTREQMAAFLNRAAPRASTVDFDFPLSTATPTDGAVVASVSVNSLNNEYIFMSAAFYTLTYTDAGTFPCENVYQFFVDGGQVGKNSMYSRQTAQPAQTEVEDVAGQTMVAVGPGSHTVEVRYHDGSGSCHTVPGRGNLTAQVTPFGGNLGSIAVLSPAPLAPTSGSASSMP